MEDSPWSYLLRHNHQLAPQLRHELRARLAQLPLPTLTFVLHASGVEVGRRNPASHSQPEEYATIALEQMRQLQMHMEPYHPIDTTASPPVVAKRV